MSYSIKTIKSCVLLIVLALTAAGLLASSASASPQTEAPIFLPELPAMKKLESVVGIKALTKSTKKLNHATDKRIAKISKQRDKLFTSLNKDVAARDKARTDFLKTKLPGYEKSLLAPYRKAYNDGLEKATDVYSQALRKARAARAEKKQAADKSYKRASRKAYWNSREEIRQATKDARARAKAFCKKTYSGKKLKKCLKQAAEKKLSTKRKQQIIDKLNDRLGELRDQRNAAQAKAEAAYAAAKGKASAALRKQQEALQAKLEKGEAAVATKVDAARAANTDYYRFLLDRETNRSDTLKSDLRAAITALKNRSK